MTAIKVSVICTSYNYERYIGQALDSFLAQKTTFPYEIIIVDDCSTDASRQILEDYAARYPDIIRLFFNSTNKGLTQTWIDICKKARGQYIARCDADDYWIDELKLQKQVDLLDRLPDSKWCNTDFHIVNEGGQVLHEQVFVNGPIAYANTYEKMLATKGMTLPSSWLVDTALMLEVNAMIDPSSVDDGFPMQLEFFRQTQLAFLPEATVAYRMTQNSDSRPKDSAKIKHRVDGLLKTQLEYINKYPDQDFQEIARLQAEREAWQEMRAFEYDRAVRDLQERFTALEHVNQEQHQVLQQMKEDYGLLLHDYNCVVTSRRWTIPTKIINVLRRRK